MFAGKRTGARLVDCTLLPPHRLGDTRRPMGVVTASRSGSVRLLSRLLLASLLALVGLEATGAEAKDAGGAPDAALVDAAPIDAKAIGDAEIDAGPSLEQQAQELRAILVELESIVAGKMPSQGYFEDLFPFDVRDPKAVAIGRKNLEASIVELDKRLLELRPVLAPADAGEGGPPQPPGSAVKPVHSGAAPVKPPKAAPDAGAPDALDASAPTADAGPPTDEATVVELQLGVAKARLAFLKLSDDKRLPLLEQDAERKRVALEKERANSEREKALAEQKRAEEARQKALEQAEQARNELQRVVANESARMEGVRGALAAYKQEVAERRQGWATEAATRQEKYAELIERAKKVTPQSPGADKLYDELIAELTNIRANVRIALDAYRNVPEAPRYTPDASFDAIRERVPEEERTAVESNVRVLGESAAELEGSARTLAWETLEASVTREHDLNDRRIALLERVTRAKRSAVLGFGAQGIAQLQREVGRLALEGRWYYAHAEVRVRSLGELVRSPLWIGQMTWTVLLLVGVLAGIIYARRKGPDALEKLRVLVVRSVRRPALARPLATFIAALASILRPLVFLLGVLAARRALGETATLVELSVPLRLLIWYASYRLFTVATHRGLAWVISGGAGLQGKKGGRSERILRSVRIVARYGFAVAIVLTVAAEILGEGYLFNLVLRFAWLGAIPIFALLVKWWRNDITDAYLDHKPKGRLAGMVRSTRERWFGFFVAVAAFVVVLGQALLRALRRFVLGFEQTRKALAFLFRRRLEKKAAASSLVPTETELPEDLRQWFSEEPVNDETYAVTELPGLEEFDKQAERWAAGEKSAAVLVVGETGFGKTSWLNNATLLVESANVKRVNFDTRLLTQSELLGFLKRALALDARSDARADVIEAIVKAGPQIIMLDDLHHLLLRGVGTYEAWNELSEVIERTRTHTFWVATMGALAFQHLGWARGGVEPFRKVVRLGPWDDARISLLINARTRESEYEMVYDDLVVDKLEGVDGEAQLVSTQQGYTRLIWDYADGCPRVALHCWKNSLVPDGDNRVRVRLFQRPNANALEALSEVEKFVLAGVAWHTTLTLTEAVRSLKYAVMACEDAFDKLQDLGIVVEDNGRFRIATRWLCPVLRYLKRKHLFED
jgi:hypothetical protein